jgi:hypothetical protein
MSSFLLFQVLGKHFEALRARNQDALSELHGTGGEGDVFFMAVYGGDNNRGRRDVYL